MNIKELFYTFLPLLFLILFGKIYFSSFFLIYPGDIIFAFAISILTFRNSGVLLYIFIFFLGLLEGLDFLENELIFGIYFVLIGIIWNYLRKYFSFESFELKISFWFFSILSFLIFRYVLFFYKLDVSIDWRLILNLAVKSFYYVCMTFVWILIFYKILNSFLSKTYEKV